MCYIFITPLVKIFLKHVLYTNSINVSFYITIKKVVVCGWSYYMILNVSSAFLIIINLWRRNCLWIVSIFVRRITTYKTLGHFFNWFLHISDIFISNDHNREFSLVNISKKLEGPFYHFLFVFNIYIFWWCFTFINSLCFFFSMKKLFRLHR